MRQQHIRKLAEESASRIIAAAASIAAPALRIALAWYRAIKGIIGSNKASSRGGMA